MAACGHSFSTKVAALVLLLAGAAQAAPARIVSTSLCGDAYVLALAKPAQITALSWQAGSKLSAAPKALRAQARGRDDAERLLALSPSLVVLGPGEKSRPARLVQRQGARVFALKWVESFDGVYANLAALGDAMAKPQAAQMRIAGMKTRLAVLRRKDAGALPRVLYLAPGGMSAGAGTFVDAAIRAAGGRNDGALQGISGWGRVKLEKLALDPPDLVLVSFFDDGYASVADLRSHHPLLQKALKSVPVARIRAKHWVCAGPLLVDAVTAINAAIRALPGGAQS